MSKPVVNNKVIYPNIYGRVIQHDTFLNQGVKQGDSPTFSNLRLTEDAFIEGNLYVQGNSTILDSNVIEFEDNILLINRLETSNGVTLNQSGLEIERGSAENYRIVFQESDDTLRTGFISNLQAVAVREDNPLPNGFMIWNNSQKRIDSTNTFNIDLHLASTTDSINTSTGILIVNGGVGIQKNVNLGNNLSIWATGSYKTDLYTNYTTNNFHITSPRDIVLTPTTNILIPYDKGIAIGTTEQNISVNSLTSDINITGSGHINFFLNQGKRLNIPNQIPITFSTPNEKIYTDGNNNMVITGQQDILLSPGTNKKIFIDVNKPIVFGDANQGISSNLNSDLSIYANNHIFLTPGQGLDIRIPTDNTIKLGGSGNQRIYANSNNELNLTANSDIFLTPSVNSHVNLPDNIPLTFGGYNQSISSSNGNLIFNSASRLILLPSSTITSTEDSINGSTGSLYTHGGLGVQKTFFSEKNIIIDSNETNAFVVRKNNNSQNILNIDNSSSGKLTIFAGNGTSSSLVISNISNTDAYSLLQFNSLYDSTDGYSLGHGTNVYNDGRALTVNLPSYSAYSNTGLRPKFAVMSNDCTTELFTIESDTGNMFVKGSFGLINTEDATNATTASFILTGGLGVVKSIYTNGKLSILTNSTQALYIADNNNNQTFIVDTINKTSNIHTDLNIIKTSGNLLTINNSFSANYDNNSLINNFQTFITNTSNSIDTSSGAFILSGGAGISGGLHVGKKAYFKDELDMNLTNITNLKNPINPQDAATKSYVDLVKQGLYVKDSVTVATITSGNLSDYSAGYIIDNYTLVIDDRILVKDQTNQIENGIYIVQSTGPPIRSVDMSIGTSASGVFTFVKIGDINGSLGFICNSVLSIVGTDSLNFTQFTGLGQVDAGDGLSKNFNQIYVNVDNSSLEIVTDSLRLKNTAVSTGLTGGSGAPLQTISDQSHVSKLGTINTGTWQASTVQVVYGGTGRTQFNSGNILFGNGLNSINTNSKFLFDDTTSRLGLGTNSPQYNLHVQNTNNCEIYINANSDNTSPNAKPEIILSHTSINKAVIGYSRNYNDYANNIHAEAFVFNNFNTGSDSIIQFATQQESRLTILSNGNIGINTSDPSSTLHVIGSLTTTDINTFRSTVNASGYSNGSVVISGGASISKNLYVGEFFYVRNTTPSTSSNAGAVIVQGGLTIQSNVNATNLGNGGGLTVIGGGSIGGDLYLGGHLNGSGNSSSTFAYLTLTATDNAINLSTGTLITLGGITIQTDTNSTNVSNGGALLIAGGGSIGKDLYVGGNEFNYGQKSYFGTYNNIINFKNSSSLLSVFSIDRNNSTNHLSISRYNSSGNFIEYSSLIDYQTGITTLYNSTVSSSPTTASFVLIGGMSINSSVAATSLTNGGGLTNLGGQSISKNLLIGGDVHIFSTTDSSNYTSGSIVLNGGLGVSKNTNINGTLSVSQTSTFNETTHFKGNTLLETVTNTTTSSLWFYMGQLNDSTIGYCDLELSNGISSTINTSIHSLKFNASINNTTISCSHSHLGNLLFNDSTISQCIVYNNPNNDSYHLFIYCPQQSVTNIRVNSKLGNRFILQSEGTNSTPSGSYSNYDNSWTISYNTNVESNLKYAVGDLTVEGTSLKICDNIPIIGYNNSNTTSSRDIGLLFERFQISNDAGTGDIVNDIIILTDSLPLQSTVSSTQIRFSNSTSNVDDYYVGWWIKVTTGTNTNQVRQIIAYDGDQRVATINSPWTSGNPDTGDSIDFYNFQYTSLHYTESLKKFKLGYTNKDPQTNLLITGGDCDLQLKNLYVTDTTISNNSSTGGLVILGGISINNTNNSTNCTNGGALTIAGGTAIRKQLCVGDNIRIGNGSYSDTSSIYVNQTSATITLQNDTNSYSFIDFIETSDSLRYGILNDTNTNLFSLTYSTSNTNPFNSIKAFTLSSNGNIGINTTSNINGLLTLRSNNFITTNSDDGFLGLIPASTNFTNTSSGSRIILYGNNSSNPGDIRFSTGTSGSHKFFTNNETLSLSINQSGTVSIFSSTLTKSRTSGSLLVSGGIGIQTTENSESNFNGGALTVAGGAAINKDLYLGGNLYITGNLNASGSVLTPTISFTNTQNCSVVESGNIKLLTVSSEGTFSFYVNVTPSVSNSSCSFEFTLPSRTNTFTNRGDFVAVCTGYTDDTTPVALFNVLCIAAKDTPNGMITFQSASTNIHYFTVLCRYTLA
jgi:hypothetical protein